MPSLLRSMAFYVTALLWLAHITVIPLVAQVKMDVMPVNPELQKKFSLSPTKEVYFCADAKLYFVPHQNAAGEPGLFWGEKVMSARLWRMTPYRVVSIDKVGAINTLSIFSIRVDLGGGQEAGFQVNGSEAVLTKTTDPVAELVGNDRLIMRDAPVRSRHLEAIIGGRVELGMTSEEVECSLGKPDELNDYGNDSMQWVYGSKAMYVYTSGDIVTNIQRLHE